LQDLEPGSYELTVRAWDVFNNPGETTTTFTVAEQQNLSIRNVYNYPNPTSGYTRFIFDHNQAGSSLDVLIRVFTLSGKPVAQLRDRNLSVSGGTATLEWDGMDADGNRLASGTYLYHVRVSTDTDTRETVEKLVIIR
jgi:flagellar hook assembly protein FlgD